LFLALLFFQGHSGRFYAYHAEDLQKDNLKFFH
jgi:hypothetical protein